MADGLIGCGFQRSLVELEYTRDDLDRLLLGLRQKIGAIAEPGAPDAIDFAHLGSRIVAPT